MRECDLIMKGGVTSGVVYPFAITQLKDEYRLRKIGGTSAGAIAAAIAGAAEYRRQTGGGDAGFDAIGEMASTLGADLGELFQPAPELAKPFDVLRSLVSGNTSPLRAVLSAYRAQAFAGLLIGGVPALIAASQSAWGAAAFFALLALVLGVVFIVLALKQVVTTLLPAADFGLCPGKTQPGRSKAAFTDWIADQIDLVATGAVTDSTQPLTVGDLERVGIEVAAMTSDLSTQRPYQLPLRENRFWVRKSEMTRLFADRIVDYLCPEGDLKTQQHADEPDDLYPLKVGPDFPVLLIARMSLSFPGLISAVPLWRVDYDGIKDASGTYPMVRLLFSDGGVCSNFPVHLFDAPLPGRPTFGIKLGPYDKERNGDERVDLPQTRQQVEKLRTGKITGIGGFVFAILNTAKDWNDTLQSQLPGYAERIVEIRLDAAEGGMNFEMDANTVTKIQGYGKDAGTRLLEAFASNDHDGFDQHRFQRATSVLPALEDTLVAFHKGFESRPADTALSYDKIMTDLDTRVSTSISKTERREVLLPLMEKLSALGAEIDAARTDPDRKSVTETGTPQQDAGLRLVASADRRPKSARGTA